MKDFLKKNRFALSAGLASVGSVVSASLAFAQATTLDEVTSDGVGSIVSTYTASLIANLPAIIVAVVGISLVFVLIKLALRWVKKSVH